MVFQLRMVQTKKKCRCFYTTPHLDLSHALWDNVVSARAPCDAFLPGNRGIARGQISQDQSEGLAASVV